MTLLYAIGAGALVNVAVAVVGRLLRLWNVRFDPSGESLVVGIAAAIIVAALGLGARPQLVRIALLGLGAHLGVVINRFLGVAFTGRTPVDGTVDAFLYTPLALTLLAGGLVLGHKQASQGQVLVLAQVVELVIGTDTYGDRPAAGCCEVAGADVQSCHVGRYGSDVG